MTVIHSSDLGWTAGQDISEEFAAFAKTLQAGDTFVFDHMYDISGTDIEIASNVTLRGGVPGAGFNVTDTLTNSSALISLSDGSSLIDLTVTHENSSSERTQKITFKVDADDITILNSSFSGNTGIFLDITGSDLLVKDAHFDGGFYQMRWLGDTNNFVVENTLFENSLGDGIKTARGEGEGTKNATIIDSVFLNNGRDGIDTTGGFKDSYVINSYFVGNGVSGMDIKTPIWEEADLSLNQTARNIIITGSEFINNGNDIVLTTNDRAELLTDGNAYDWLVQDIFINDTIFENTTSTNHAMVLAKGATGVYADNVTLLGKIQPYKDVVHNYIDHLNIDVNSNLNISNVTTGSPRPGTLDIDYASMAGPDWSNISYPVDGTATPVDLGVDPDPISYTPSDEQDQVDEASVEEALVEDPVLDGTPVTNPSALLDIFVAYTDTDETISQIGDGSRIDSGITDGRALTFYATASGDEVGIGSVRLTVNGVGSAMENVAPYALFGDSNGDFLGGKQLSEGTYTAELIVYSGKNGSGDVLETVSFDFTVGETVSAPAVTPDDPVEVIVPETDLAPDSIAREPYSRLLDIKLFDTGTDKALFDLRDGTKLSSSDLAGLNVTLSAAAIDPDANIGSVRLEMDGMYSSMENVEPYALFGDKKGDFLGGTRLADGTHVATLTAYSDRNGKGDVLEQVTLSFEIGDYDSFLFNGSLSTVLSYSSAQDTGTATVSDDQSKIELKGSAWKALDVSGKITGNTVLEFDFKSDVEGEIHGIGFIDENGDLESMFFQLDGSQQLGIQDFNNAYETGSGFKSYTIPVGEYFTGSADQLVLINDDDAGLGAMSAFNDISLIDLIA